MKKLTLDKIAELAGVSRATVSRVVNNYPHIKPEVRERVQAIIAETGFQPNLIARSLASDRSGIIGLVIPNTPNMVFTDPFFPTLIRGISQATNQRGLTLSLFLFKTREEETRAVRSILTTGLLDGLIVTADRKEESFVPQFAVHGLPFVLIGRPETNRNISYVDTDNVGGAFNATEHLINLNRRRIALVGANENTAGDDRAEGYFKALQAHDIPVDDALIAYGDFSMESGYRAMKRVLPANPDAVFIASDTMALGAMGAIREAGLRVPDDISVVGFDNLQPALHADPPLTTVEHPIELLGMHAVELLSDLISSRNPENPIHRIFPTKLIVRASCGAVLSETNQP